MKYICVVLSIIYVTVSLTGCNISTSKAEKVDISQEMVNTEVEKALNIVYNGKLESMYLDYGSVAQIKYEYTQKVNENNIKEYDITSQIELILEDIEKDLLNNDEIKASSSNASENKDNTTYEDIVSLIDRVKEESYSYGPEFYKLVNSDYTIDKDKLSNLICKSNKNLKYDNSKFYYIKSNEQLKSDTLDICGRHFNIELKSDIRTLIGNKDYEFKVYSSERVDKNKYTVNVKNKFKDIALSIILDNGDIKVVEIYKVISTFNDL